MSFLNDVLNGNGKAVAQTANTVSIEVHPQDNAKSVLRFGAGKDDWIAAAGEKEGDLQNLAEILSKAIESPSMLRKIQNLPVADRPTLRLVHGMDCCGSCNGENIMIAAMEGTGYEAAATFAHEFQHQYQFKHDGINKYKDGLTLAENILDDRIFEAAAETAGYQYLFEIRDKNAQSSAAFVSAMTKGSYAPGMRAYYAAKKAGKSEGESILAGMAGYASSFGLARSYERSYHSAVARPPAFLDFEKYMPELQSGRKQAAVGFIDTCLSGKKLDVVAAFKSHTVGMTDDKPSDEKIEKQLHSPQFNFVTSSTMRLLNACKRSYRKITGKKHPNADDNLTVRNAYGWFNSKKSDGLAGAMYLAENARRFIRKTFKNAFQSKIGAYHYICDDRREMFSFDGVKKNPDNFKNAVFFRPDAHHADYKESSVPVYILNQRTKSAEAMLSILMKDKEFKKQLTDSGSDHPVTFGFDQRCDRQGYVDSKAECDVIVLNSLKTPQDLAKDFKKLFKDLRERQQTRMREKEKPATVPTVEKSGKTSSKPSLMAILSKQKRGGTAALTVATARKKSDTRG